MADGTIRVKVTVDTTELRHWAGRHADNGHHGVAHVLYKAANDGESLTEQAIREAKAEVWDEGYEAGTLNHSAYLNTGKRAHVNPYRIVAEAGERDE